VTKSITVDATPPQLSAVGIASNNADPSYAKAGDIVTLDLDSSEPIAISSVTIAGVPSAISGSGTHWHATLPVDATLPNGLASISINYADSVGNPGETGTTTTNNSDVVIDLLPPVVELNGLPVVIVEATTPYLEAGATALDAISGNVSGTIQITAV
jgi:hypothetical protein